MSIPNVLTLLRFIMIPIFGYLLYQENYIFAASIFVAAALTDVLDGYIARRYNMITSWGKLADPAADKLMTVTALTILTIQGRIQLFVIVIVVLKEALMGFGGLRVYRNKKHVVSANWYGKVSTVVFYLAIVLIILRAPYSNVIIMIAVASALFALALYIGEYFRIIKGNS